MIVNGLISLNSVDRTSPIPWTTRLKGKTLLQWAVDNLRKFPHLSKVFVLSDRQDIADEAADIGVETRVLPGDFFRYGIPLLTKEHWILSRNIDALKRAGANGQVLLLADWRNPQISRRTYESLYHQLMENRVAARTVCASPIDPNVFTRLEDGSFFPVWADLGTDRQSIPQLLRACRVGAVRPDRLLMPAPETLCVELPRVEALSIEDDETMQLAEFYLEYKKQQTNSQG